MRTAWRRAVNAEGPCPRLADVLALLGPDAASFEWTCDAIEARVFEATRPGDDRPWLAVRVSDGGHLVVATRSRALLDDLRRRFAEGV
jgi:hypothetical protein